MAQHQFPRSTAAVEARHEAAHIPPDVITRELLMHLSAPLVASMAGVKPRAVRAWSQGTQQPRPQAVEQLQLVHSLVETVRKSRETMGTT